MGFHYAPQVEVNGQEDEISQPQSAKDTTYLDKDYPKDRDVVRTDRRRSLEPAYGEERIIAREDRIIAREIVYGGPPRRRGYKESNTVRTVDRSGGDNPKLFDTILKTMEANYSGITRLAVKESLAYSSVAQIKEKDKKNRNILHHALEVIKSGNREGMEIFRLLINEVPLELCFDLVSRQDKSRTDVLGFAAEYGLDEALELMIQKTKDHEERKTRNQSIKKALHIAARKGHWELVGKLVQNQISSEILLSLEPFHDTGPETFLHRAVRTPDIDTMKFKSLVKKIPEDKIADLIGTQGDDEAGTVLHVASRIYDSSIIETLITSCPVDKRSSAISKKDSRQRTPLHWAARNTNFENVQILANSLKPDERELILKMTDDSGCTVLHCYLEREYEEYEPDDEDTNVEENKLLAAVKFVVEHCPGIETILDDTKTSAYRMAERLEPKGEISTFLLRKSLRMEKITSIKEVLYDRGINRELNLDLSRFDGPSDHFNNYLDKAKLSQKRKRDVVRYERILKSLKLPKLDALAKGCFPSEARKLFEYLKGCKVEQIFNVEVPDRPDQPHTDEEIIACLNDLIIERLYWRKKDFSVQTLIKAVPQVQSLHLISSGNEAVLNQWTSPVGLCLLTELRDVEITIVGGAEPEKTLQDRRDKTLDALKNLRVHNGECRLYVDEEKRTFGYDCKGECKSRFGKVTVTAQPPLESKNPDNTPTPATMNEEMDKQIYRELRPIQKFSQLLEQKPFLEKASIGRKVRVALIDCGVDAYHKSVESNIAEDKGRSFIEDQLKDNEYQSHWHTVTHPHGTQMAYLICNVDPYCELYVAKVCVGIDDVDVPPVVEAIKWAKEEEVDIISMSLSFKGDRIKLRNALDHVGKVGNPWKPLVFASTAERGNHNEPAYPAEFSDCFAISAATIDGKDAPYSDTRITNFYLPGEKIETVDPEYITPGSKVPTSGSSVATALAAGLASLILTLVRFTYPAKDNSSASDQFSILKDHEQMEKLFLEMKDTNNKMNLVSPSVLFDSTFWESCPLEKGVDRLQQILGKYPR